MEERKRFIYFKQGKMSTTKKINRKVAEIRSLFGGEHVYFKNELLENICLFFSRWSYRLTKGVYYKLKYFIQRRTRGFDDLDKWNAAWFISRKAIAILKEWRKGPIMGTSIIRHREDRFGKIIELEKTEIDDEGYPPAFTEEEWLKIIDDIIFAFEFVIQDDLFCDNYNSNTYKEKYARHKRGLKLFSIYLMSLWD